MLLPLLALLSGCPAPEPRPCAGDVLFGEPNANTGLNADQCAPSCADCSGAPWTPPEYTPGDRETWLAWTLIDAPTPSESDPYAGGTDVTEPGEDAVCGFLPDSSSTYRVVNYDSTAAAVRAGASVTHYGRCGTCSSLQDLSVYAANPDLTDPVRACGLDNLDGDIAALTACIAALGFTDACATTWAWNTLHTRDACLTVCIADLDAPYNNANGSLNDCLQCDEDESGAVFKAVAGRTRRNTGLASSICRPCSEVKPLVHAYPTAN